MWKTRAATLAILSLALLLPSTTEPGSACGPWLPTSILQSGDSALKDAPVADFFRELRRLSPKTDPHLKAIIPPTRPDDHPSLESYGPEQTDAAESRELAESLKTSRLTPFQQSAIIKQLADWRKQLRAAKPAEVSILPPPPAGLPEEFSCYEAGAARYHAGDLPAARERWQRLLTLPAEQRKARTVWASYMIGRSWVDEDPAKAIPALVQCRTAAREGFADSIGLAAASLGWEARARWKQKDIASAVELFLQQAATGDGIAVLSLLECAATLFKGDDAALADAARDTATRQLLTVYIISQNGPRQVSDWSDQSRAKSARWLKVVEALPVRDIQGADQLAWAAYQTGDLPAADRWLNLGGPSTQNAPIGQWIRAKLLLREGKVDQAATYLAKAAAGFPKNEEWPNLPNVFPGDAPFRPADYAAGELAVLRLGRAQFVDAMDLFYRHDFWQDAAYIAERVLSADELKSYVDKNWPEATQSPKSAKSDGDWIFKHTDLRDVLARRLTRLGRWKEARPYFPKDVRPVLDSYITAIRNGNEAKLPAADRAQALWQAARIARSEGMRILGTELSPDWAIYGGSFDEGGGLSEYRLAIAKAGKDQFSVVSQAEQQRLAAHAEVLDKRYHYRYIAADHAWAAAALMPDNSEQLARLLIEAGSWLKYSDPKAADRFYKALVTRCPKTPLGQQAATMHWFPPLPSKAQPAHK